ncbi:MAG: hypothetical protein HUU06_13305, partial [Planctomycetaceae bacterium]|nr:hypothetical protein [Planctomycetaceae bacterium]
MRLGVRTTVVGFGIGIGIGCASCGGDDASSRPAAQPSAEPRKVVLYTSLNEPTARTVVSAFEKDSGIRVQVVSDTERD